MKQPEQEPIADQASASLTLEALADSIKADINDGDHFASERDRCYVSAGRKLIEARDRIKAGEGDTTFEAYLSGHDMSKSRAYELIRIAEGKTTVAEVRKGARNRMAKSRNRSRNHKRSQTIVRNVAHESDADRLPDAPDAYEPEIDRLQAALDAYDALDGDERAQFLKERNLAEIELEPSQARH
jgi:hypothetical protein